MSENSCASCCYWRAEELPQERRKDTGRCFYSAPEHRRNNKRLVIRPVTAAGEWCAKHSILDEAGRIVRTASPPASSVPDSQAAIACRNCLFWRRLTEQDGTCRVKAPKTRDKDYIMRRHTPVLILTNWPITRADDFCAKHRPASAG